MNCQHAAYCQHKRWTADDDLTRTTSTWYSRAAYNLTHPRRQRRMEQVAQAGPWAAAPVNAPPVGGLNPGETAYRTLDVRTDALVQLTISSIFAALVGFPVLCIYVGVTYPVVAPLCGIFAIWDGVTLVFYARQNWDVLWQCDDKRRIVRKREPENTQPTTDPQVVTVKAEIREGRKTIYDRLTITDYPAWHRFCVAVDSGRNFSETEAKKHKVPRADWETVSTEWIRRGWVLPAERRKTPELRAVGRHWVKAYATTPPQSPGENGVGGVGR